MKDLQSKSKTELAKLLATEQAHLRDLRWQVSSDQHKKVRDVRVARKLIAQILTLLNNQDKKADKTIDKDATKQ